MSGITARRSRISSQYHWFLGGLALFGLLLPSLLFAQSPIPGISIAIDQADTPEQVAATLQIIFLLTILTLAPALVIMTTSSSAWHFSSRFS
jgi:flagellar biosynthesis protein FliP